MFKNPLFAISLGIILGIILGTQFSLLLQSFLTIGIILWLNSRFIPSELNGLPHYLFGLALIAGLVLGDISYFIQTGGVNTFNFQNPFVVHK